MHLTAVEQIIITDNNQYMISKSKDSVFVWRISQRYPDKPKLLNPIKLDKNSPLDRSMTQKTSERFIKSSRAVMEDRELDSVVKYRKDRAKNSSAENYPSKLNLSYTINEAKDFIKEILYSATRLMRCAPKYDIKYACSFGIETRYGHFLQ